jgi:hypothetical protein
MAASRRKDPIVGEIVRILIRADEAALARIYALAKRENAAMDAHTDQAMAELLRRREGWNAEPEAKREAGEPQATPSDTRPDATEKAEPVPMRASEQLNQMNALRTELMNTLRTEIDRMNALRTEIDRLTGRVEALEQGRRPLDAVGRVASPRSQRSQT